MALWLLQEAVPDLGESGTYLAGMLAIITTLLSAYTLTQKGRLDDLRAQILAGEKREAKGEGREDAALDRLGTATATITSLTTAINEFGGVLKDTVAEIRRNAERSEAATREIADLKREAGSLREVTVRETGDLKREISELRREVGELVKELRIRYARGAPE